MLTWMDGFDRDDVPLPAGKSLQFTTAAIVVAQAMHYARLERFGLPFEDWATCSSVWKHTLIEHADMAIERALDNLHPIVERPKFTMVKAPSPVTRVGSENAVGRGVETSADSDPEACAYCACVIETDTHYPYCSIECSLCARSGR